MSIERETIEKLCNLINNLDDIGCLLPEEQKEYEEIMAKYNKEEAEKERIAKAFCISTIYGD